MGTNAEAESKDPHATLETALIEKFLATRGYALHSVNRLPAGDRQLLLRSAAAIAALKLAEIDARAHFVDEIG